MPRKLTFSPLFSVLILTSFATANDHIIYKNDFSDQAMQSEEVNAATTLTIKPQLTLSTDAAIHDNALYLNRQGNGVAKAVLPLQLEQPCRVTLKLRLVNNPVHRDQHWGVTFTGNDGRKEHFYCRGNGLEIQRLPKVGERQVYQLSSQPKVGTEWTTVSFRLDPDHIYANLSGQDAGSVASQILPLQKIELTAYNNHIAISDLQIDAIPSPAPALTDAVFYASFDNQVDATYQTTRNGEVSATTTTLSTTITPEVTGYPEFLPGVKGQALRLAAPAKKTSKLRIDPQWVREEQSLASHSMRNVPEIKLDLPDLTNLSFTVRIKRLATQAQDQHIGLFMRAVGKEFRFLTRGTGVTALLNVDSKEQWLRNYAPKLQLPTASPDSDWITLRLIYQNQQTVADIGGEVIDLGAIDLGAISQVSLYSFGVDAVVDQFAVVSDKFNYNEDFSQYHAKQTDKLTLRYPADNLFDTAGGVMFWISPLDDPKWGTNYHLFNASGDDNTYRMRLTLWHRLRLDIARKDLKPVMFQRLGQNLWNGGDWVHLAVTWNAEKRFRIFVNSLPYLPGDNWAGYGSPVPDADFTSITNIVLESAANALIDELKIYRRPVSNADVYADYRSVMPFDLLQFDSVVSPETDDNATVRLAPGGEYMRPLPSPGDFISDIAKNFKLELRDLSGQTLLSRDFNDIKVSQPVELALPVGRLESGYYRLVCTLNQDDTRIVQSFPLKSYVVPTAKPASLDDVQPGQLLFSKTFSADDVPQILRHGSGIHFSAIASLDGNGVHLSAGASLDDSLQMSADNSYLEAGASKGNRFAVEISFADQDLGKPALLEIDWPDDKPRMMGLYLYPQSNTQHHRDRLQGGIQTGHEYPSSGKIQTTRYIIYPGVNAYLFEARTMAKGYPAAVQSIRVYSLPEGLPRLAINYPAEQPQRRFGNVDEDQTMETNLNQDYISKTAGKFRTQRVTEELLNYFDYTGQDTLHYPLLRYGYIFYPLAGHHGGLYPYQPAEIPDMLRAFKARGKHFVAIENFSNIPEIAVLSQIDSDYASRGLVLRDHNNLDLAAFQGGKQTANPIHPEVQAYYNRHLVTLLTEYGSDLDAIELWPNFGFWRNLKTGYDDYTITRFSADTGITVPATGRYDFLTSEQRESWLRWRAEQVSQFFRNVRANVDKYQPGMKIYLAVNENRSVEEDYTERGLDVAALQSIDNFYLIPMRPVTEYRWAKHWGKPELENDAILYNMTGKDRYLANGSAEASLSVPHYFETFGPSLQNDKFASYFQNADVKPHGRYFLKELAYLMAVYDSQEITYGQQPIGTMGREREAREFARAYLALPRQPFTVVGESLDPVAVRYLVTEQGTYFYVVSQLWSDCEVSVDLGGVELVRDLSSETDVAVQSLKMLPYQLRSFFVAGQVRPVGATVKVPEQIKQFYSDKVSKLQNSVELLQQRQVDVTTELAVLTQINQALDSAHYAEAHRLCFSRNMNQLAEKQTNIELIVRQQQMIAKNHFAVNCGENRFYSADNNKLFFPDRSYNAAAGYGHIGNYLTVARDIENLKEKDIPLLYQYEAYDIDGYQFDLANGVYKVKLYMKIGYEPGFYAGRFVFSVFAQNKPLFTDLDMYEQSGGDFGKPVVMEFDHIQVTDGKLLLKFKEQQGRESNARLVNGIEIIRVAE